MIAEATHGVDGGNDADKRFRGALGLAGCRFGASSSAFFLAPSASAAAGSAAALYWTQRAFNNESS